MATTRDAAARRRGSLATRALGRRRGSVATRALALGAALTALVAGCAAVPVHDARRSTGAAVAAPPTVASAPVVSAPVVSTSDGSTADVSLLAAPLPALVPTAARPCTGAAAPRRYQHVIWIVMENKPIGAALGRSAPATRALATKCGYATAYHGVTHPSLPNYIAMTSGSTHGIRDDADPSRHRVTGPSIFSQVAAAHLTWATYAESMTKVCQRTSSGRYAVRHNPATYYTALARTCAHNDVAMGTTTRGPLVTALRTGRLPTFTFMVPNLCSDTHDCSVATGDRWLSRWLAVILASKTYAAGRTAVFVTWDEDDNSHANRVLLLTIAPSVRPRTVLRSTYSHLDLLRTTEDMLGLAALPRRAVSMRRATHL